MTHARAGEAGVCRVYKKKGKQPEAPAWAIQNGAERHEGGPVDWSIQGQRAQNPGSSRAEQEGGADKMPTQRAQATRLERPRGKEGKRPRTGQDRQVRAQSEISTRRREEEWGEAAVQYGVYRKRGLRCRLKWQAGDQTSSEHAGRAGHNAAKATCGAHIGERDGSKASDTMPCAAEQCPTRQS